MSNNIAMAVLERLHRKPVMADPASNVLQTALSRLSCEEGEPSDIETDVRGSLCAAYGFNAAGQDKPFVFQDGVAVIPVHGALINRFGRSYGYVTGYNFIRAQRDAAMADPDVKAIVYDVNSPGGEASGCFELADESFDQRGGKPTIAVVDSDCYSAAYAFASTADKIVVTPTGGAGSIGVYTMHVDMSKMLEDWGLKMTLIHAGAHKVDGNPFGELPDDVRDDMQASVNKTYDRFVSAVARNRNLSDKAVRDTEARCYNADDALALGLIDGVASPQEAIRDFLSGPGEAKSLSDNDEEQKMSDAEKAAAQKAERERIKAITGSEHAKGREDFASHLAYETDMSAEDATVMLSKAPRVEPAAPKQEEARTQDKGNAKFLEVMNGGKHPEVGADPTNGEDEKMSDDQKAVNELLSGFQAVTGRKL